MKQEKENKEIQKIYGFNGDNYIRKEVLGKGTYGEVVRAQHEKTQESVAIKIIKMDIDREGIPATALRELTLLRNYEHSNLVRMRHMDLGEKKIMIALDYIKYDLKKYWDEKFKNVKPDLKTIKNIMYQILKGMDHLHGKKVLHRDLKPQNILITENTMQVKIADFGLSRWYTIPIKNYTKEVLTLWYRSPELILGGDSYSVGIDMWSIGCIFGELLLNKPLFRGNCEIDQLFEIFQIMGSPNEQSFPGFKTFPYFSKNLPMHTECLLKQALKGTSIDNSGLDLLSKMLSLNPCKRITCREALKHQFFNDYYGNNF